MAKDHPVEYTKPNDLERRIADWPEPGIAERGLKILERRYLMRDNSGEIVESPKELYFRVASVVASADSAFGGDVTGTEREFYDLMAHGYFLPNSPTLRGAGLGINLSACYVLPIEDSRDSIFGTMRDAAEVQAFGGGTGFNFSRLRAKGSVVRSTKGTASGPVSFMEVYDIALGKTIAQGGTRQGANMGILRYDHPDIMLFIHSKEKPGVLTGFNISVGVTEEFMDIAKKRETYPLIDHQGEKVGELNAGDVFDAIVKRAWTRGDPGIIFLDRIDRDNPTPQLGRIESTNPCVVGSTLIPTENGLLKIEELENKEDITTVVDYKTTNLGKQQLQILNTKIQKVWCTGIKEVSKLTTLSGFEVIATTDHKILTKKGWKELQELTIEDEVAIQSRGGLFNKNYNLPINKFINIWSKQLGQILGFLIGDGWFREGKNCRIGFTFGNKKLLKYFKPLLNKLYGKQIKYIPRKNNVIHLSYHSKEFVEFFKLLGVRAWKSKEKRVPESIFTAPQETIIGFLQGLFSADGTISIQKNKTRYVRLTSKSRNLLKDVQILLLNLEIFSKIYERHREKRLAFKYKNIKGEIRLYECDGELYELQISKDSLLLFLNKVGFIEKTHNEKTRILKKCRFYKTKFFDKVYSIEPRGKEKVFDLTEPITHSFIANGIIVHNCGEQPLLPYEACNLGSINLANCVSQEGNINFNLLEKIVVSSIHFLDNVIDVNSFPLEQINRITRGNRKIGLGVMGFADMLIKMGVVYGSEESLTIAEKVMKFINEKAKSASVRLAETRGTFPNWEGSVYDPNSSYFKGEELRLRNAALTTIAPTGTLSNLIGVAGGIEPILAVTYERSSVYDASGKAELKLPIVDSGFERIAKAEGFYSENLIRKIRENGGSLLGISKPEGISEARWNKVIQLFATSHEIDYEGHIKMQAAFQRHVGNAVSKTVNFPQTASEEDVRRVYFLSQDLGTKGVTIYRDKSIEGQPLSTEKKDERPQVRGTTVRQETPHGKAFLTYNVRSDNGQPYETFINIGKGGRDITAIAEGFGRLLSLAHKWNIPLEEIIEQLEGISGETQSGFGDKRIRSLPDAIAKGLEEAENVLTQNGTTKSHKERRRNNLSGNLCPDCGTPLISEAGCQKCDKCGHSKC